MIEWNYVVVGLSIPLLLFLLWKETRRQKKARLLWRLSSCVFATVSLACLALPLTYQGTEFIVKNNEAILLTEGFSRDSVRDFARVSNKKMPVLTTTQGLAGAEKYDASYSPDASLFLQKNPRIKTVHVFGYGLPEAELSPFKYINLVYHPSDPPSGITSIRWSPVVKPGEKLTIQGSFNNVTSKTTTVFLRAYQSTLDSIKVEPGQISKFELATVPKHTGRTLYTIAVVAGKDTIGKEPVPVQVAPGETVRVLMLAASPDFEAKFLKNWLSQNGYAVAVRTAISKNKFNKDFLNTPVIPLDRITPALLSRFDLIIADAAELTSISKPELAAIQTQVANKSLGLIIKADSVDNSSFYSRRFPLVQQAANKEQQLPLLLSDSTTTLLARPTDQLLFIRNSNATRPLVQDKQNRIFAGITLFGTGKIILTTVSGTFNWALSGAQQDYAAFWTTLLDHVSAKPEATEAWTVTPFLPEVNKAVQLHLQTNQSGFPHGQMNETTVYLKANAGLPYQWTGTYFPSKEGWQTGIQLNGAAFYWYTYGKSNWKQIRTYESFVATKKRSTENKHMTEKGGEERKPVRNELPKIFFFSIFLFSAGFLWLENKI